ncbi:hypothetical protein TBR22_A07450 [Luteitalea sp. TBR-22]|uniref:DUF4256 domain-containing protein n=1 Tax=Luteitalea sp. TBR-22 TaxID=2802971 RepID=UPI001AF9550A|nr:DUF4256 domain-containing protein [Luteitalea sp. TBR-22]BCS31544.1 hypothetical protein TBR22_A07450 [Luteitalea sp. TBR-22]
MARSQPHALLEVLRARFAAHGQRHAGTEWDDVQARLQKHPTALKVLAEMEATGGEPDLVDLGDGALRFVDCAPESPAGRRSLCYDRQARVGRKNNAPSGSAVEMAEAMGLALLTEDQYRALQGLGEFDRKTSSWIGTPEDVRSLGGALFCDRRFGRVFTYHNGADSYYAARGFRGALLL